MSVEVQVGSKKLRAAGWAGELTGVSVPDQGLWNMTRTISVRRAPCDQGDAAPAALMKSSLPSPSLHNHHVNTTSPPYNPS
ncbi:hypothetical protein O3P69_006664 [Scylla paramamosain]|uniref:Uncharacterized protein n=1 Tax=Scylla paramamosain TaxID=85552 RepID=A0AAW0U0C2_SCYPA